MAQITPEGTQSGSEPILVSIREAAQRLRESVWDVHKLLNRGVIASQREGVRRMVNLASLLEFDKRADGGAP